MKIIIIGDIHGRTFWKEAVKDITENDKVIFLGDYLDPYPREGILRKDAIENFKEILAFKREYPDNVILLWGNHDHGYLNEEYYASRTDNKNWDEINNLYHENFHLFQLCYYLCIDNKPYVFSHAGILKGWLEDIEFYVPSTNIEIQTMCDIFNSKFIEEDIELFDQLYEVSIHRGGWHNYGSMIWADIHEHFSLKDEDVLPFFQIVGHTQLTGPEPIIGKHVTDLDVRTAFILNKDGSITRKETK